MLVRLPISARRREKITSGTSANGIPNDSTTWLSTRTSAGLIATPSTISAGVMVIARRKNTGIRRRRKPCMTTWPAIVPTDEEEMPDASSAMPKISPLW